VAFINDHQVRPRQPGAAHCGLDGDHLHQLAVVSGSAGADVAVVDAGSNEPAAGVVKDLPQVGQEPHAAAAADAQADDLGSRGSFPESGRRHKDRRTMAGGVGLAQVGDGLVLAGAEVEGHRSATTCSASAALVIPT